MKNSLFVLLGFNLINSMDAFFVNCHQYTDKQICLEHDLCKWCNITTSVIKNNNTIYNTSNVCKYATSYVEDNDDICVYGNHYLFIVKLVNIIINLALVIIFFVLLTYIVNVSELILNKYFESSTNQDNDRVKEKGLLVTIITLSLFAPAIIFLVLQFNLFLLYLVFILILTIIISCSINTRKLYYYKNKEIKSYEPIQ